MSIDFTPQVRCETCPGIYSRKNCLHRDCLGHQADLTAYQRKIDNHVHAMAMDVWYPRTRAPDGSIPSETRNNEVSRRSKHYHTYPRVETSGDAVFFNHHISHLSPDKLTRAGLNKIFSKLKNPHSHLALVSTNDKARSSDHTGQPPFYPKTEHALSSARSERDMISIELGGSNPSGRFAGMADQAAINKNLHEAHGKPCIIPS